MHFVVNDSIPLVDGDIIAVTLHAFDREKLRSWLAERAKLGHPKPLEVWSHRPHGAATHATEEYGHPLLGGSSGLLAVKVAREKGFTRILLAGVPMTTHGLHMIRKRPWTACESFRRRWMHYRTELSPFVRSFSGWTAETFGRPDLEFLAIKADADL